MARGAQSPEYVFLLVFLMIAVAVAYRSLGTKVGTHSERTGCFVGDCDSGGAGDVDLGGAEAALGSGMEAATSGGPLTIDETTGRASGGSGPDPDLVLASGNGGGPSRGTTTSGGAASEPDGAPAGEPAAASGGSAGGLARSAGRFALGFGRELWDTAKGTVGAALHPADTWEGLKAAVRDPGAVLSAARQQYLAGTADSNGRLAAAAALTFTPAGLARVGAATKLLRTGRAAEELAAAARATEEAAAAGAAARTGEEVATATRPCVGAACLREGSCFAAGTPVTTADGAKAIEKVKAGDVVLARDPESGETVLERVARTFVREASDTVDVELTAPGGRHEHLTVTAEHPFHVHDKGFRAVADLAPGDLVDTATGTARVTALATLGVAMLVYNFEVEHAHTYFVGDTTAWVHNACRPPAADFERSISRLPPGERVAEVRQMADRVAAENNWTRDRNLERLNPGRTVYRDAEGNLYSVDTQHGRFEQLDRRGRHVGEINMDRQPIPGSQDPSGGHNLRVR